LVDPDVDIGNANPYTIEMYFKYRGFDAGTWYFYRAADSGGRRFYGYYLAADKDVALGIGNDAGIDFDGNPMVLNLDMYVAVTYDGNDGNVTHNGTITTTVNFGAENIANSGNMHIFQHSGVSYKYFFNGYCDEYRVSTSARDLNYINASEQLRLGNLVSIGTEEPTYSDNSTSSTVAGTEISHNLKWTDDTALDSYIFSFLNESNTVGFAYDEDGDDLAMFYRNGSFTVDTSISSVSLDSTLTDHIGTYTIPTGFSYYDILGFMYDADLNDMVVFFRNGSYAVDFTTDFDHETIEFTANKYLWTLSLISNDFEVKDVIGFTFDAGGNDGAVFFRNGSFLVDVVITDWISTIDFTEMHDYITYANMNVEDCIGFAYDSSSDDACMYFINKSAICDVFTGLTIKLLILQLLVIMT